jgi:hypothetical protein
MARHAGGGIMSLLSALRNRLAPRPKPGVVIEYFVFSPNGAITQRDCVTLATGDTLAINLRGGWTQIFTVYDPDCLPQEALR